MRNWLNLEQQCTADSNAYAQFLRRERDLTIFQKPDKAEWIEREVDREAKKIEARVRSAGIKLTKEQQKDMRKGLAQDFGKRFEGYFNAQAKEAMTAQKKLIEERMAWFGVEELEADAETRVREILVSLPENKLFDGIVGEGAIKTRGEVLAFIRNPLFYEARKMSESLLRKHMPAIVNGWKKFRRGTSFLDFTNQLIESCQDETDLRKYLKEMAV